MFFVNNIYRGRQPYRVQEIQKDRQEDKKGGSQQRFQNEDEAEAHEKFLKASEKLYKKRSVATAREIMNKQMVTLSDTLSVEEAWEQIRNHDIKHYPIIGVEGKFLGLLSEVEILRHLRKGAKKKLHEITSAETLCADPETEFAEILDVFSAEKIEAVPIVDKKVKVVGILTQNDLIQTMIKITNLKL
ncbi:MAG: CBS domain-containing protein [Candidatus Neptunochlamydia sp.]|nr:CBS domain-containing protein [Candidatus Neptunochlamydia sp.]